MSGHSKWHNIKLKKGKVDAQRGALFTKLSKEIILAAKSGSADPEANYRLKMAVERRAPSTCRRTTSSARSRVRAAADNGEAQIEEIRYEGYGPARDRRDRRCRDRQPQPHRRRNPLSVQPQRGHPRRDRKRRLDVRSRSASIEVDPGAALRGRFTESALVDGVDRRRVRRVERRRLTEPAR